MIRLTRTLSALLVVIVATRGYANSATEAPAEDYEGLQVVLKPTEGMNRKVRLEIEGRQFSYIHEASNLFPCRQPEPVTIRRVRWHDDVADVHFESDRLGSGQIRFIAEGNTEAFKQLFWAAFGEAGASSMASIIGNSGSHVYHLTTCNHLPDESYRVVFDSTPQAKKTGYRECPLCFMEFPHVRDYLVERQLGLQAAAQARLQYPPVISEEKQNRLDAIGQRVLSRWPSPLKGYDYSFMLVESDSPNAFATPGGKILMTSALYEQSESDAEIEAVLAHEIAHVEKRHGYRQYQSARRAAMFAGVAAVLGGALGAHYGSSTVLGDAAQFALVLGGIASALILTGYEREHEEEADAYAAIYFEADKDPSGKSALVQMLRKLKYSDELRGRFEDSGSVFASHPAIDDRIDAVTTSVVGGFPQSAVFQGSSEDGKLVATLQLEMQRAWRNPDASRESATVSGSLRGAGGPTATATLMPEKYSILATIYTTAELGKPCEVKRIKVVSSAGKLSLENTEKTEIHPLDTVGVLFETLVEERKLLEDVLAVDLDLPHVTKWTRIGKAGEGGPD